MLPLDSALVRARFPAFAHPPLEGHAFFENAGGSYTSAPVLHRLDHFYRCTKVQPYGAYPASEAAGEAMDLAYERIAAALNVGTDWVQFGPSTSANTYVLGRAFSEWIAPGDVIVVTDQDHEANSGAWRRLEDHGAVIREWTVDPETGHLDLERLDALLDEKVRILAFPHCSNIVGEINPAAEIVRRAHAVGAIAIVDGVSFAPHGLPDVGEMDADIYLFSAYKVYGPHQGIMAVRPSLAAELPNQGHFFNDDQPRKRLSPAGPDHAQIAACAGIADYLEEIAEIAGDHVNGETPFRRAHAAMRAQEVGLLEPLMAWLGQTNRARLIGPHEPEKRAPTISLALPEPGFDVARRLARHDIMAGGGHFYAWRTLRALGIDPEHGVLRLSFVHYTSSEEIERLVAALDAELA